MRLKKIELTLENCEVIKIPGKYIGTFLVDKIRKCISRVAANAIIEMNIAGEVLIEIHRDANKSYKPFGIDTPDKKYIFDRLIRYRDITQIDFVIESDDDRKSYHYSIEWPNSDYNENDEQISFLSHCGHLYIVISKKTIKKKWGIYDFFDEDIDDEEEMDCHFRLLGIGDKYYDEC